MLLSVRDADTWWTSASSTIFQAIGTGEPNRMVAGLLASFTPDLTDEKAAKAAYLAHNQDVHDRVADRLVEWRPGDGWSRSAPRSTSRCRASRSPT